MSFNDVETNIIGDDDSESSVFAALEAKVKQLDNLFDILQDETSFDSTIVEDEEDDFGHEIAKVQLSERHLKRELEGASLLHESRERRDNSNCSERRPERGHNKTEIQEDGRSPPPFQDREICDLAKDCHSEIIHKLEYCSRDVIFEQGRSTKKSTFLRSPETSFEHLNDSFFFCPTECSNTKFSLEHYFSDTDDIETAENDCPSCTKDRYTSLTTINEEAKTAKLERNFSSFTNVSSSTASPVQRVPHKALILENVDIVQRRAYETANLKEVTSSEKRTERSPRLRRNPLHLFPKTNSLTNQASSTYGDCDDILSSEDQFVETKPGIRLFVESPRSDTIIYSFEDDERELDDEMQANLTTPFNTAYSLDNSNEESKNRLFVSPFSQRGRETKKVSNYTNRDEDDEIESFRSKSNFQQEIPRQIEIIQKDKMCSTTLDYKLEIADTDTMQLMPRPLSDYSDERNVSEVFREESDKDYAPFDEKKKMEEERSFPVSIIISIENCIELVCCGDFPAEATCGSLPEQKRDPNDGNQNIPMGHKRKVDRTKTESAQLAETALPIFKGENTKECNDQTASHTVGAEKKIDGATKELLVNNGRLLDYIVHSNQDEYRRLTDENLVGIDFQGNVVLGCSIPDHHHLRGTHPQSSMVSPSVRFISNETTVAVVSYLRIDKVCLGLRTNVVKMRETRIWENRDGDGWINVHYHQTEAG